MIHNCSLKYSYTTYHKTHNAQLIELPENQEQGGLENCARRGEWRIFSNIAERVLILIK